MTAWGEEGRNVLQLEEALGWKLKDAGDRGFLLPELKLKYTFYQVILKSCNDKKDF